MINKELSEILNADKKARDKISDSSQITEGIQKKLDEDREILNRRYADESHKIIEENSNKHTKILENSEKQNIELLKKNSDTLNELSKKNMDSWVSAIVSTVTEVEKQ